MANHGGLRTTGWVFIIAAVLFYITSVMGLFWPGKTPTGDIGLYAITVVLLGFGVGTLWLRYARMHPVEE